MNLIGTVLVYVALIAMFIGAVSIVRPLRFLRIASRPYGLVVLLCGIVILFIGATLPAPEKKTEVPVARLDEFVPAYQFAEFHSIQIKAPRDRVFRAIKQVTADEIFLFRTLVWIRRFGQPGPENILNPGRDQPLLDVATRTGFLPLAEEPNREIVLGTLVAVPPGWRPNKEKKPTPEDFKALRAPGFALGAINFRVDDAANGETLVTTETRVCATDASARRKFARYWRTIYPGSALIRVMWLRAIQRRAEKEVGLSSTMVPVEGGLYIYPSEGAYRILKVLKVEEEIVHVRTYKNKYGTVPGEIDPASLEMGSIHDKDGFGIGHLPLSKETFASWRPQFLRHTLVTPEELEGYETWKESKGGVW